MGKGHRHRKRGRRSAARASLQPAPLQVPMMMAVMPGLHAAGRSFGGYGFQHALGAAPAQPVALQALPAPGGSQLGGRCSHHTSSGPSTAAEGSAAASGLSGSEDEEDSNSSSSSSSDSSRRRHKAKYDLSWSAKITRSVSTLHNVPRNRRTQLLEHIDGRLDAALTSELDSTQVSQLLFIYTKVRPNAKIADLRVRR